MRRLPLLPALIFMIVVTQLPFVATLVISFMRWNALEPNDTGFTGFSNYKEVFTDSSLRGSVIATVIDHGQRGAGQPGYRAGHRAAAGPEVPRPGHRPHAS